MPLNAAGSTEWVIGIRIMSLFDLHPGGRENGNVHRRQVAYPLRAAERTAGARPVILLHPRIPVLAEMG
jgi:hypothetical protein